VGIWVQTTQNDDDNKSPTTANAELTALGSCSMEGAILGWQAN